MPKGPPPPTPEIRLIPSAEAPFPPDASGGWKPRPASWRAESATPHAILLCRFNPPLRWSLPERPPVSECRSVNRLLRAPSFSLLDEKRPVTYAIVFGIWAEVFLYCLLHDQYLIRISPEHFTVYHPPLWGIRNLSLLATAWAFRASIGPGLVLGLAALFLGRAGKQPKLGVGTMLKVVPVLILVTELAGLIAGGWVWKSGKMLYPEPVYPDFTLAILVSQTIQVTCYAAGALVSVGFLGWIVWKRRKGA